MNKLVCSCGWVVSDSLQGMSCGICGSWWPVSYLPRGRPPAGVLQVNGKTAAEDALDAIAALCGCPQWEYPGQVVRDVEEVIRQRDARDVQWPDPVAPVPVSAAPEAPVDILLRGVVGTGDGAAMVNFALRHARENVGLGAGEPRVWEDAGRVYVTLWTPERSVTVSRMVDVGTHAHTLGAQGGGGLMEIRSTTTVNILMRGVRDAEDAEVMARTALRHAREYPDRAAGSPILWATRPRVYATLWTRGRSVSVLRLADDEKGQYD